MFLSIVLVAGAFAIVGLGLCLIALAMAPFVIDKVDSQLAPLAQKGNTLTKGYPFSMGRMGWYGFVLTFRNSRLIQRWVLRNRSDRCQAIDSAPSWMVKLMVWVYLGFIVCALISLVLGRSVMFLDKHWHVLSQIGR